jgi:hypothetical protein
LGNIRKQKEKSFPGLAHAKCPMGCIAMLKKSLGEKRYVPMKNKENNYRYHYTNY